MVLARIAPHTAGYDIRTFDCPARDHSESSVVHFEALVQIPAKPS
jgi:hypothetical protein